MPDVVIPRNASRGIEASLTTPRLLPTGPAIEVPVGSNADESTLSELQKSWLRPEFTEALVEHMTKAKRAAILDQQE